MNEEQTNEILEEQEVDYKAEYEKLVYENQRKQDLEEFTNSLRKQGLEVDGNINDICETYGKEDFNKFLNLLEKTRQARPIIWGYAPQNGEAISNENNPTFENIINETKGDR